MPDFALECSAGGIVAGVDEAGRGPLAGPVVAAAVIFDAHVSDAEHLPAPLDGLDDSKRLTRSRRLRMFDAIMASALVGIGAASVAEIDRLNVLGAALLAMKRAVVALPIAPDAALVDGNRAPDLPCPGVCIVGGDGRSLSIAAASVIAKVTRDRAMTKLDAIFPVYGWDRNAGYGTAEHLAALDRCGPTWHHRQSFRPVATRAAVWAKTHTVAPRRRPAGR